MSRTNLKEVLRIFIAHANIVDQQTNVEALYSVSIVIRPLIAATVLPV